MKQDNNNVTFVYDKLKDLGHFFFYFFFSKIDVISSQDDHYPALSHEPENGEIEMGEMGMETWIWGMGEGGKGNYEVRYWSLLFLLFFKD